MDGTGLKGDTVSKNKNALELRYDLSVEGIRCRLNFDLVFTPYSTSYQDDPGLAPDTAAITGATLAPPNAVLNSSNHSLRKDENIRGAMNRSSYAILTIIS
jgi:hypothetical protein